MVPIYQHGPGQGIGYSMKLFSEQFIKLCGEHLEGGRAKAFAFIFYDFEDLEFRRILDDQGVFTRLDRLSGDQLSIFYLNSGNETAVERFNAKFLSRLGFDQDVRLPCIVFFRVSDEQEIDVAAVTLENASIIHGFLELHENIKQYIAEVPVTVEDSKYWKWFTSGAKFISLEALRASITQGLASLFE
jgi:hypothetical protein